ncbi:hypothetical protein B296_00031317, partial [Ensete ventricosum]
MISAEGFSSSMDARPVVALLLMRSALCYTRLCGPAPTTAASAPAVSLGRCVCQDLLVLISKSDTSILIFTVDMTDADLAAKSSRPRTARSLTWPNQRDWSKDTRCRTADLAQVRSATPTCRCTPHHQYGRYGERRGSM